MNPANADILANRLTTLIREAKSAVSFLKSYQRADAIVTDLTANQKQGALQTTSTLASNISSAYQDVANAFTAHDPIEE